MKKAAQKLSLSPLGDRVVVAPAGREEVSVSGIIIPDAAKEKPERGVVVAVGPGKWNEDGDERVPMTVKVGDTVIFSKYGFDEVKIDGKEYYLLSESSILAVIND